MADGAGGLPAKALGVVSERAPDGVGSIVDAPDGAGSILVAPDGALGGEGGSKYVRYSDALAGKILARVAAGDSLPKTCRGRDMPNATTVYAWARAMPRFGRALAVAHQTARRAKRKAERAAVAARWAKGRDPRGRWCTYTPELGEEICWRMIEGQTLKTIGADPEMPCAGTILRWVKEIPDFEDRYVQAREMMADLMFDEARDEAQAATPATVWAQKLKVDTIFKMVSRMRPRKYCERVLAEEAIAERKAEEDPNAGGLTVIVKRFSDVTPEEEEAARLTEEGYFDRPRGRLGRG